MLVSDLTSQALQLGGAHRVMWTIGFCVTTRNASVSSWCLRSLVVDYEVTTLQVLSLPSLGLDEQLPDEKLPLESKVCHFEKM